MYSIAFLVPAFLLLCSTKHFFLSPTVTAPLNKTRRGPLGFCKLVWEKYIWVHRSLQKLGTGYRMKQVVQGGARPDGRQGLGCHGPHTCSCAGVAGKRLMLCLQHTHTHTLTPTYIHVKGLCMYVCTYKYIYLMSLPPRYIRRAGHCSHTQSVTPAGAGAEP